MSSHLPDHLIPALKQAAAQDAERFLQTVAEYLPDNLYLLLWELRGKRSTWTNDTAAAVRWVKQHRRDVYLGMGLSDRPRGPHERVPAAEVAGIVGLVLEVDVAHPVHAKKDKLPPTREEAQALIDALGLLPSLLIDSGHGLQGWWLWKAPWVFYSPEERQQAAQLSADWNATLREHARRAGWVVDSVFDLARIMRIPGSENGKGLKLDPPAPVVPVKLLVNSGLRYSPEDVTPYLIAAPAPHQPAPGETVRAPLHDLSDDTLLAKACSATKGSEFSELWEGGQLHHPSASEADLALCGHLAFWTAGDPSRMDTLFRRSGRMRAKWDERRGARTYGEKTIAKALEGQTEFYTPSGGKGRTPTGAGNDGQEKQSGDDDITTPRLAQAVLSTNSFAVDDGLGLYVFDHGVYKPRGERRIKAQVKRLLLSWGRGEKWSTHRQNEVTEFLRVDAPTLWPTPPLDVLNCLNGLLDVKAGVLRPHSPDFLSPVQIPVIYDPKAKCPAWLRFSGEVLPEDAQGLLFELAAWLMLPDTSKQKATLLLGDGSNGKSASLRALTAFLGSQNCSAASLHKLEADRFVVAQLLGKLANLCADLLSAHLEGTGMFKQITGGDVIYAERKYMEGFSFLPYARLVFSANHPPQSRDASPAFFRRWLCVPFTRVFEGEAARPREELDAELASPGELSGVLNMALAALARVRDHGVTETPSMREAMGEFRAVTDPLAVWIEKELVLDPTAVTPKRQLVAAYNEECHRLGRPVTTDNSLGRALRNATPDIKDAQRTANGKLQWCWLGVGLRSAES